jgi:hypothetical protein
MVSVGTRKIYGIISSHNTIRKDSEHYRVIGESGTDNDHMRFIYRAVDFLFSETSLITRILWKNQRLRRLAQSVRYQKDKGLSGRDENQDTALRGFAIWHGKFHRLDLVQMALRDSPMQFICISDLRRSWFIRFRNPALRTFEASSSHFRDSISIYVRISHWSHSEESAATAPLWGRWYLCLTRALWEH